MNKLVDQVVSLELAKKLKELNVKQEGFFHWVDTGSRVVLSYPREENDIHLAALIKEGRTYCAFTADELGDMLPNVLITKVPPDESRNFYWFICYRNTFESCNFEAIDVNEANARAKILIYLIENGLLLPEAPHDKSYAISS